MSAIGRFASPQLLALGRPPRLASSPFQTLLDQGRTKLVAEMAAIGVTYDVGQLATDPAMVLTRTATYRDELRRIEIDDAVARTYLGSATGASLDQRAADYGVLRRIVVPADLDTNTVAVVEDDEALLLRARLAWEALSVAGPAGAYVFHALDAHPEVLDAASYGPETGYVPVGHVLVVVQSRSNGGVPSAGIIDVIAQRLDAYQVDYADGTSVIRPVRDEQSVRPLGARVTVAACQPINYTTTATLYLRPDGDREAIRLEAERRLVRYQEVRRRIGTEVSLSARSAALSVADADGLPIVEEVDIAGADIVPNHRQLPVPNAPIVTAVVR